MVERKHCASVKVNWPGGVNERRMEEEDAAAVQPLSADKASLAVVQTAD